MNAKLIALGAAALVAASASFGSFYVVDQGERGVVVRNGSITAVKESGLGFKMPFVDSVSIIDIRSKAKTYTDVTAISSDQQVATLALSFNYSIPGDKAALVYSEYGSEENLLSRLVERQLMAQVRNVFGRYNAHRSVTERAQLNADIQLALQQSVDGPVTIETVQIENVAFSEAYNDKIEERMSAEIEVQKLKQNAEREKVQAQITVTKAEAQAGAIRATAQAQADAVRLQGEAEAAAIKAKGAALRDNPTLIDLTAAEKWNGSLPTTMVPGSATPFVNVK
ncbi:MULTISPECIES: prohibitin family protein [Brucella]|uniref:prohibitin family protein n=1 Tax=Brucella/Ochrobactrum group TaxID=2826938 RepID=UPI0009A1EFDB|nr:MULTISPECIES: prohibitin family protein [Brucella]MBK0021027.1 prohibitin family protein [Ochrobactrum sp. S45]MBK0042235.1 prohibitin family protein [Ochrobactrum sp. S46]MQP38726.1 prohibitin family protein [Ochrobactrum sp. MYb237]QWK78584.1 prohibitin family protein [Ochrobactrum sp. BTU1]PQZ43340.1 Band 7 protein [Brucella pseudogrignonensis]